MSNQQKNNNFIKQAGILAIAGVFVKIIGTLYRSPLTAIIGNEGNGYYGAAFNIYLIVLTISSYSIPTAVSNVVSKRLALKQYKNAQKVFQCSLYYVLLMGVIASLVLFFGAEFLVEKNAAKVLRIFAPTIVLYGFLGVLRGYFQAHRSMVQTSVSQILEQIMNAVVSVVGAYFLTNLVIDQDSTTKAIYGAIGSALGTGSGVLIALLFMIATYGLNRSIINKRIARDQTEILESSKEIYKVIIMMVTPIILSSFIYNASTALNQTIFTKVLIMLKQFTEPQVAELYGIFSQKAVVLANLPVAIGAAMSSAMIPTVSGAYAKGEITSIHEKIANGIRATMLISIPAAVGLAVLAEPIVWLLFPQKDSVMLAANLLKGMSITVIFYQVSTISNGVLQGIGKVNIPVINALIALVLQTLILIPMLIYTEWNLYCLVIVTIIYAFMISVLNQISVYRYLGYKQEILKTFIAPLVSAMLMGMATYGTYKGVKYIINSNVVSLLVAILVAVIVYFVSIIIIGGVGEDELKRIPKGYVVIRIAKKMKLLKR